MHAFILLFTRVMRAQSEFSWRRKRKLLSCVFIATSAAPVVPCTLAHNRPSRPAGDIKSAGSLIMPSWQDHYTTLWAPAAGHSFRLHFYHGPYYCTHSLTHTHTFTLTVRTTILRRIRGHPMFTHKYNVYFYLCACVTCDANFYTATCLHIHPISTAAAKPPVAKYHQYRLSNLYQASRLLLIIRG